METARLPLTSPAKVLSTKRGAATAKGDYVEVFYDIERLPSTLVYRTP